MVVFLKKLAAARQALSQLPQPRLAEAQQLLIQCGQSVGLALFNPAFPAAFEVTQSFTFGPQVSHFGLKYGVSFDEEMKQHGTIQNIAQHWQEKIQMAFRDPTLHVVSVQKGSVILGCESLSPLPVLAQNAIRLARGIEKLSLPSLEGFAPNFVVNSHLKIDWVSPSKLKEHLALPAPPPAVAPSNISQHSAIPPVQQGSFAPRQQEELLPLTRDDYLMIAKKFGDRKTVERIEKDSTFKPWEVTDV